MDFRCHADSHLPPSSPREKCVALETQQKVTFLAVNTCLVQNPDIPQAGRVGAHGGAAGRSRAGLYANRTVRLGDNPFSNPPKHGRHVA